MLKKLQSLSEKQKIAIIVVVVVIATLAMGYFWVKDSMIGISKIGQSVKSIDLPKIDLPDLSKILPSTTEDKTTEWKTYTSDKGKFSLQYPPDWKLDDSGINGDSIKSVIFSGNEGIVQIDYGQGFGGMCEQGYEKIEIGNKQFDVCHDVDNGVKGIGYEEWAIAGKQFGDIAIGMFVTANPPYLSNRETILKILSTFKFTN